MAYDSNKDKQIHYFNLETGPTSELCFSIRSYNGGKPKLQISRTRDENFLKVGRLSLEEVEFLREIIDEMIDVMKTNQKE